MDFEIEVPIAKRARNESQIDNTSSTDDDSVQLISVEAYSIKKSTTTLRKAKNIKTHPWKSKFLELFKWLRYEEPTGTATCSQIVSQSLKIKANSI